jgi:hypothetical protein
MKNEKAEKTKCAYEVNRKFWKEQPGFLSQQGI